MPALEAKTQEDVGETGKIACEKKERKRSRWEGALRDGNRDKETMVDKKKNTDELVLYVSDNRYKA